jgi:hypothetical protein
MTLATFLGYWSGLAFVRPELGMRELLGTMLVLHICDAIMCRLFARNNGYPKNLWTVSASRRHLGRRGADPAAAPRAVRARGRMTSRTSASGALTSCGRVTRCQPCAVASPHPRPSPWSWASSPLRARRWSSTATIAKLNDTLLAVLKNAETLGFQGRLEKLKPAVADAFDLPFMAEKSIGRYWKPLSERRQGALGRAVQEYTAATYAGNFDHFGNQRSRSPARNRARTTPRSCTPRLVDPGTETTELDYRLHQTPKARR